MHLLDQVRERIRYKRFSIRTEEAHVHWVRWFIRFHQLKHPKDMGSAEVTAFLSWLAAERGVAPSTHKQVLSALLFLYREVLKIDLPWMNDVMRPKDRVRMPTVLSVGEVARLFAALEGQMALLGRLLYGTGLRLMEALSLRVACMAVIYLSFVDAKPILRKIGRQSIDAATRIVGFFGAAMGMGLIFNGAVEFLEPYRIVAKVAAGT